MHTRSVLPVAWVSVFPGAQTVYGVHVSPRRTPSQQVKSMLAKVTLAWPISYMPMRPDCGDVKSKAQTPRFAPAAPCIRSGCRWGWC